MHDTELMADLVLEGGGVKGIAHVGAIDVLVKERRYSIQRVAGSSAGAVVAALVAAGVGPDRLHELMSRGPGALDYGRVPQASVLDHVPLLGKPLSVILKKGIYKGDHLRDWLHRTLEKETGITKFGQLPRPDQGRADLTDDRQSRLVVMVADVSLGQLVRLPWDCGPLYGLDPNEMLIADAVRASTSIPFFFRPFILPWKDRRHVSYMVDGGTLSDFPIEIFDRTDGEKPRWPTFGIKLERKPPKDAPLHTVNGTLSFARALFETAINGNDEVHLADPSVRSRTMFIDTSKFSSVDFDLSQPQAQELYEMGQKTAADFIGTWSWPRWKAEYGSAKGRVERARKARGEHNGRNAGPLAEAS